MQQNPYQMQQAQHFGHPQMPSQPQMQIPQMQIPIKAESPLQSIGRPAKFHQQIPQSGCPQSVNHL
jgi:hypothetical protein